ncbi:MAG: ribonuclease P protein component [Prevotella sp.]|nr:ribonuclease P protein component [Prevotella sp.]
MAATHALTLRKEERICSQKLIEQLFHDSNSHSLAAFPLRAVYLSVVRVQPEEPSVKILVSVPKRLFKRAVKRNRIKRQVREAYRLQKSILTDMMEKQPGRQLLIAFLWIDNQMYDSEYVARKTKKILQQIAEKATLQTNDA